MNEESFAYEVSLMLRVIISAPDQHKAREIAADRLTKGIYNNLFAEESEIWEVEKVYDYER
jgi:hypothetical protein